MPDLLLLWISSHFLLIFACDEAPNAREGFVSSFPVHFSFVREFRAVDSNLITANAMATMRRHGIATQKGRAAATELVDGMIIVLLMELICKTRLYLDLLLALDGAANQYDTYGLQYFETYCRGGCKMPSQGKRDSTSSG